MKKLSILTMQQVSVAVNTGRGADAPPRRIGSDSLTGPPGCPILSYMPPNGGPVLCRCAGFAPAAGHFLFAYQQTMPRYRKERA